MPPGDLERVIGAMTIRLASVRLLIENGRNKAAMLRFAFSSEVTLGRMHEQLSGSQELLTRVAKARRCAINKLVRIREPVRKLKPVSAELETWIQMIRTFWTLQSKVEESLKTHHLSLAQFDLLAMLLGLGDNMNQQELANQLAVTKGNMVGLVNRLSRRGFVKRVPAQTGRRANLIRLTAAG